MKQFGNQNRIKHFFKHVIPEPNTGCWLWDGALTTAGYGCFNSGSKTVQAHKWIYEQFVRSVPSGLELDHKCRVQSCVNYEHHLEEVTHQENVRRGLAGMNTRLLNKAKTHCPHGHDYSVYGYTNPKTGQRICKPCRTACERRRRS